MGFLFLQYNYANTIKFRHLEESRKILKVKSLIDIDITYKRIQLFQIIYRIQTNNLRSKFIYLSISFKSFSCLRHPVVKSESRHLNFSFHSNHFSFGVLYMTSVPQSYLNDLQIQHCSSLLFAFL